MRTSLNTAKRSALKARGYNLELIEEVQNPSGIEFHTTYFDDCSYTENPDCFISRA